jgi:hypothetical protein
MKTLLLSCAIGIVLASPTYAETEVTAYTGPDVQQLICNQKSDHTNLRSAPSAKDSTVYRALENGEQVEINGTVTNDAGALWYEVTYATDDGEVMGYIIAAAVNPTCTTYDIVEAANTDFTALPKPTRSLVEPGTCELIVAARQTLDEAKQYAAGVADKRFLKIFQAENGWYAVSIGALRPEEEEPMMAKWKASGKIPSDAYCSTGEKYVAGMRWSESETPLASANNQETTSGGGVAGALVRGMLGVVERMENPSPSNSSNSDVACVSVAGQCTGGFGGCSVDKISLSGGPGSVDNSWHTPMICSIGQGIEGTYQYTMQIGNSICSGSFPVTAKARSSITIDVFSDTCSISFINEY